MTSLNLNKSVTVFTEVGNKTVINTVKYKDAEKFIYSANEIEVNFCYVDKTRRDKWLNSLGFVKSEIIYENTEKKHDPCKYIYKKAA